jgi:hypothetical protein
MQKGAFKGQRDISDGAWILGALTIISYVWSYTESLDRDKSLQTLNLTPI